MKFISILLIVLSFFSCSTKSPEIFQWRGKDRLGIFQEKNLLKIWPENGPKEIWFLEGIGSGYGSPTITDTEIYITGAIDSTAT
ncbi:MAG: hypothetical protein HQ522_09430, partial [Bacteroidetes bacterium]|nr:hypothetical protein [Bacteroidota bacterium]